MKNKAYNRGFSMVELMVAISIIAIITTIVIATLNSSRSKGVQAAMQVSITQIRNDAEIIFSDQKNFDGICDKATVATFFDQYIEEGTDVCYTYESGGTWHWTVGGSYGLESKSVCAIGSEDAPLDVDFDC